MLETNFVPNNAANVNALYVVESWCVPAPDEVIFKERWQHGEWFRAGMIWKIGKGKVFYFRPGHETYPIFKQAEVVKVLANACIWLGNE